MRTTSSILATIALAGCAAHPAPATAPVAVTPAAPLPVAVAATPAPAPAAVPVARADTAPAPVALAGAPAPAAPPAVDRRTIDVLGDSTFFAAPAADSAADEPSWDIDVRSYETQDRVAHYVSAFTGRAKGRVAESLARGTRYEAMIRSTFRAGGIPEDMYYLALVESGFDPNAYSRAAAVGMWQFMTSTGRDMGLRIDWWVDERRDPVRSTVAAARFIRGLRDQFGSLYLAAAAYNGGPGRVARGLAKYSDDVDSAQQPEDAFFVLAEKDYLRNETREYVPQLIAAALVAKEPARYGIELRQLPPFAYDSVRVPGATPLAAVARAAGSSTTVLRELNPHLLRGMTPPGQRMLVRVPVGAAATFDGAFAALPAADRVATRNVTSRKGDRVESVAEAHGISAAVLEAFNPHLRHLKPSGKLVPGQDIVLPTPAVASAATHVPDPTIEKYGSRRGAHLTTHTVRRGETLGAIARKYGTTTKQVMRLNGLKKPIIFAGQDLIVSGSPKGKAARGKHARTDMTVTLAGHPVKAVAKHGGKPAAKVKAVKAPKKPAKHSKAGKPAKPAKPVKGKTAKRTAHTPK